MKPKRPYTRSLIASLLFLGIALTLFIMPQRNQGSAKASMETREQAAPAKVEIASNIESTPPSAPAPQVLEDSRNQAPATEAAPDAIMPTPSAEWIKRTLVSEWMDGPDKLVGRQRVRIVEADFKYPFLRLEEAVTLDTDTGEESVNLIRASVADHLILGLRPDQDLAETTDAVRKRGFEIRAIEPGSYLLVELPDFESVAAQQQAITDLMALEEFINHAEPDYLVFPCLVPNDPAYAQGRMWGLHNPGTEAGSITDADIDAPEAWDIIKDAPDVVVAVTDTGVLYTHEDLAPNMWTHPTNGEFGFDAYDDDNDPMDLGGHGTHCAGTIGARGGNGIGLTGVAWNVQLMAVRFLGPNGGTTSDAIRAVNYSRQNGAHIISASWGGGGFSQSLSDAIKACGDAGIPFVAAAGNSSANNDATPHYPSSYKLPNIVAVASTTKSDQLSPFSCYGRTSVDIGAPGSSIWSTHTGSNSSYTYLNGTSMATPHVSGALALAKARFPTESMQQLIDRLYASTDKIPALTGKTSTGGRLNLARLLGASPPGIANDDFVNAHIIEGIHGSWSGSNAGATREADENSFSLIGIGNKSLWLGFRTAHTGVVTLNVSNGQFDFEVVVFEGSEKGQLKVVSHSMRNGGFDRTLSFLSKPNTEYRVVLDTFLTNPIRWEVDYTLGPPNDLFADSIPLSGDLFTVTGYNRGASSELFERFRPHATRGRGKSVWWKWTAPFSGNFTINTSGSAFDTVLAVYTGDSAQSLTEVAANDDRLPLDYSSQVSFSAVEGTLYHIAVDSCHENVFGEIALNGFRSNTLQIIRQPRNLSAAIGRRAVFDVSALSATWVRYQWFFNGQAIPGQTAANLIIDPVRESDLGNYHVEIRNNENFAVSDTATLTEAEVAPSLTWSSGNSAVAAGTAVTLSATFSGSAPLTYSWTKNGSPYPGSTASISFPSAQASNAGAYRLTATNASGSATAEFILTVVNSPWERWEWRRPGIPNAAITDIKVYDGEAFAVSATQLLRSTDGINWTKSVFPQGFTGNSIAKAGTRFICTGLDASGQFRVATSTNQAATWSISIPSGFAAPFMPEKFSLIAHKGAFIAYDSTTGLSLGTFLHSTDGISWTRLMASDLSGATVELTGSGSIASDGETLILASNTSNIQGPARHFRSTDGTTWQEFETIPAATALGGHATTAFHDGERFYLFHPSAIYSSADGLTWTHHPSPGNGFIENSMLAATADHVIAFSPQFPTFRFFSDPVAIDSRNIYPTESHSFTAAASFGNKVLYGTDKGFLGLASGPYEVRIPREKSSIVASIEFTENLFIARNDNTFNFANSEADYLSGDGVTWKRSQSLNTPVVQITGSAAGRYFGVPDFGSGIYSGHNPFDVRLNPADPIGLSPNITFIGQLPNGNSIAVVSTEMGTSALFSRVNGATTWFQASFPLSLDSTSRFASLGNRWFSNVGSPNSALIRTSTNGTTWNSTGLTGSNPHFVTFGGRSWCIFTNSSSAIRAANSTNGTTWSNLATSGLPGSGFEVKRVVTFGTFLVLLGNDENLYFSENGTQWLRGFTPGKVVDLASGNGQLVAVMKNGGIIQTGTPHLGGNAPLVSILSPQTASTHLIGSRITIEGTLSDPEDGAASYECFVDSQLVASGSGTSFRFPVHITDPAGHTVTVRVRDSSGLRQMDAIRLRSAPAEPENLLENTPSGTIPAEHSVNFDDVFYVAGRRSVHRSLDGRTWEKMPIPSFANSIHGMASGNGTLVIQFDDGGIMSTRDGINWTEFQPNITQYWVREPIRFSSGVFIASYQTQGSNTGSVMTSADGLVWETGTVSAEGHLGWIAISPRGTILGGMVSGQGIFRSVDGGYNWAPVLGSTSRNSHGIFAEGRFLVARAEAGARGFFISSTEEAMEWTEHPLPSGILDAPILAYLGGNYFLGTRGIYTHASSDALAWQPLSTGISKELLSHARGLFLAKAPDGRVVTSRDGLNWQASQGIPVSVARILTNDEFYLVIGSDGSMWRSRDGEEWEMTLAGSSSPPNANKTGLSMAELHGTLIVAGSRILVCSQDEGRTWSHVNINGSPAESNSLFAKVVSSGSEVMVFEGSTSSNTLLHRSINGSEFQTVTGLPAKTWADLAWNGSEWMLLASDGSLYRSINGGSTWTQLNTTGMLRGAALVWFNHRWVIIGAAIAGVNTPYVGFTLGEGDLLQNHGTIGFGNSIGPVRTVVAHGTLLIWTRGERMFVSNNGTSWAAGTPFPLAANADYDIYHTSEGFVAFKGSTWSAEPVEAWSAGTSGLTWNPIPPPFNSIQYAENLGDRVFLFASGVISELHDKDLAITLPALAHVTLGVGDPINTQITITNLGRAIPPGGPWKVRAWLAKNRFYGDTKNIPLGTFDITAPMPAPGASQSYPVTFTLPNNILTGTNHLILQLSGPESVRETNTANNTIISDTAFVTIPEWEFSVATNGNGQVNRDFSAMRYPHKAQVSLTATAGKGAVFTGWAGDAFSPNNQITILMDGNKSVAANFSNRAHLQVFVLGKGEVTGLADLGSYPIGQTAQVTAVPDSSWVFSHWTGATHSSNASAAILMDAPKSITAHFVLPLATWKQSHFTAAQLANTAISGNEADFDHDGLTNWQEYLHGSDPTDTNSTGAGPVTLSDGFLRRTYTRNLGAESGASFACRGGRNLLSWDAADLQERILSNEDGVETIEAMLPMTGHQSGFLRFEYQDPPP